MISRKITISMFLMAFYLLAGPAYASDLAKEKRWADQIVDALIDGEAVWLDAQGTRFLGIYTENYADKLLGAAIVLHGTGVHPDWPDVVKPLRTELPNHGWATLSLQLPILENEADHNAYEPLFPEVMPRLDAGIDFLKKKGFKNIVVIGHSFGCTMAAYALSKNPRPQVKAMAVVSMSGAQFDDPEKNFFVTLPKLKMPFLDIYGGNDLEEVLSTEKKKAQVAREAGNKKFTQVKVPGANHFYQGKETELVEQVSNWLTTLKLEKETNK